MSSLSLPVFCNPSQGSVREAGSGAVKPPCEILLAGHVTASASRLGRSCPHYPPICAHSLAVAASRSSNISSSHNPLFSDLLFQNFIVANTLQCLGMREKYLNSTWLCSVQIRRLLPSGQPKPPLLSKKPFPWVKHQDFAHAVSGLSCQVQQSSPIELTHPALT